MCVCVNLCVYVYIYKCVCVGGGCLKMRCPFLLSKNPFWNQKKTPRFETLPCSTAQGGGGSFKNRKPIGEVGCCESGMAERSHSWIER